MSERVPPGRARLPKRRLTPGAMTERWLRGEALIYVTLDTYRANWHRGFVWLAGEEGQRCLARAEAAIRQQVKKRLAAR